MKRTPVPLKEVIARLEREGLLVSGPAADPLLHGVCDDSRRTGSGDLFCTWAGTASDGHDYVPDAQARGAAAALVERVVASCTLPQVLVTDGRRAAAVSAARVLDDPADDLVLVGITGTNGKTTTVWILRHLLMSRWPTASLGTLGLVTAKQGPKGSGSLTTPGPVELAHTMRSLKDEGVEAVVSEISSHALEQGRVHALRFNVAAFLNLSRDHLDYHASPEAYLAAKRSLLRQLRDDGTGVINADDDAWSGLGELAPKALRFAISAPDADVRATDIEVGPRGVSFRLATSAGNTRVDLPLLGAYNVQNALAAATVCLGLGFAPAEIADLMATVPQVPGRLERVDGAPHPILIDYAHTPDALERVLSTLRPLVSGRLIVVFGAGGDRDPGKRPLMGRIVANGADIAVVTSDNPRSEDPEAIIDDIVRGAPNAKFQRRVDRREAIELALALADPEDAVLLAGKGHETYQVLGSGEIDFDERVVVRELLTRAQRQVAE